ncbi:long-chain fatty acid--CoA ligase, partial [Candidatus Parcubacteria bacterium]
MEQVVNKPWLSLYPSEIPHEINFEERTLQSYLKEAAIEHPSKTAIHFLGKKLTFQEVYDQSLKLANYLKELGVKKGDRVSIMLPNCPQAVISYYGVLFAGGIVVQTNPLYMERELEYQINDSGSEIIITLDILYPRVSKVKALTKLRDIIVTGIKDYLPFPKNMLYPFVQKKQYGIVVKVEHSGENHLFTEVMKDSQVNEIDVDIDPENDLALLQYTGGTTGFPKGVMLTHMNLV